MAICSFLDTYNLVLDFETGGRGADTLILSAGLASWTCEGAQIEGYWLVDFEDQPGRSLRGDTMGWWVKTALEKPEAARDTFLATPRVSLRKCLLDISAKIQFSSKEYTIMSKPQDFDLPILENAWEQLGMKGELTHYRSRHNARTLWSAAKMFDPSFEEEKATTSHRADQDALAIALTCSKALKILSDARHKP